ncbi:MAG: hypothetical protein U1F77_14175 [Kiritimatiellia bacterium]
MTVLSRRSFTRSCFATGLVLGMPAFVRGRRISTASSASAAGNSAWTAAGGASLAAAERGEHHRALAVNEARSTPPRRSIKARERTPPRVRPRRRFDAVTVATCERTHAFATRTARQARVRKAGRGIRRRVVRKPPAPRSSPRWASRSTPATTTGAWWN